MKNSNQKETFAKAGKSEGILYQPPVYGMTVSWKNLAVVLVVAILKDDFKPRPEGYKSN